MENLDIESLRRAHPQFLFEAEGVCLKVGIPNSKQLVRIEKEGERYTASTESWHGHYSTTEKAIETAVALLSGTARTCREFRGDNLAATWLERLEGESWVVSNKAYYLSPFDGEDWNLFPGERWRVEKDGEAAVYSGQASSIIGEPTLTWYEDNFGPAADGMRWTMSRSHCFVLQVPIGWRVKEESGPDDLDTSYAPCDGDVILRIRTAFRDAEVKGPEPDYPPMPHSIVHDFEPVCSYAPGWSLNRWTLCFTRSEEEMMAEISLLQNLDQTLHLDIPKKIAKALPQSRFTPMH